MFSTHNKYEGQQKIHNYLSGIHEEFCGICAHFKFGTYSPKFTSINHSNDLDEKVKCGLFNYICITCNPNKLLGS